MNNIYAKFLKEFLAATEVRDHYIYALMAGLPKTHFRIFRYYDHTHKIDGMDHPEPNSFTLREFLDRFDTFHPNDDWGLDFMVSIDRIDSARAEEYTDCVSIDMRREATSRNLRQIVRIFLETYCEKCLRDNRPFEMTPETIARYDLTSDDTAAIGKLLDRYNAAARRKIRSEYNALRKLDFIRKLAE